MSTLWESFVMAEKTEFCGLNLQCSLELGTTQSTIAAASFLDVRATKTSFPWTRATTISMGPGSHHGIEKRSSHFPHTIVHFHRSVASILTLRNVATRRARPFSPFPFHLARVSPLLGADVCVSSITIVVVCSHR